MVPLEKSFIGDDEVLFEQEGLERSSVWGNRSLPQSLHGDINHYLCILSPPPPPHPIVCFLDRN